MCFPLNSCLCDLAFVQMKSFHFMPIFSTWKEQVVMFHCNLMLPGKNIREYRYTKVSLQKYVGSTLCPAVRVSYTQLKQETSSSLAGAYLLFHRLAGTKSISSDISRAESVMFRAINLRRLSVEESGTSQVQNTENGKK